MKPPLFDYYAPTTLEEALDLRSRFSDDSVVLAGGQSLMPLLNMRMAMPAVVIDLGRVGGLSGIKAWDGGISIGAMTPQREAERSALAAANCPLLVQALRHVGHPTIRNRGTVGGSIAHADGAAELPAVALSLGATLVARSVRGERLISADEFFLGFLTTALEPDELLVEIRLPWLSGRAGSSFVEVARRHGDFAIVGVAAAVVLGADETIEEARLVFMGVGGAPVRAAEAESMLRGARPEESVFAEAAELGAAGLDPPGDIHASAGYRRRVAGVVARRALVAAHAHALSGQET
jgi:aerobic carbon-monoxide dehydrogenase medium subunit